METAYDAELPSHANWRPDPPVSSGAHRGVEKPANPSESTPAVRKRATNRVLKKYTHKNALCYAITTAAEASFVSSFFLRIVPGLERLLWGMLSGECCTSGEVVVANEILDGSDRMGKCL